MRVWPAFAAALLVVGCSAGGDEESERKPVALVKLAPVQIGTVTERVTLYGAADVGASAERTLTAPTEAVLARIDAPVGSQVGQGQVVVRLRLSPVSRLELAKAASDAAAADSAYARAKRLRNDGLVSNAEVDAARAVAQGADATLHSLRQRNASLVMRAPVAGTVSTLASSQGDVVAAGTAVAKITPVGNSRVRFGVDPASARRITPGTVVQVLPSGDHAGFAVAVTMVDPVVDPQTRLASIYAPLPGSARIGAGEPLKGELDIGASAAAPMVPYAALLDDGGQPYVFVVSGGVAHRRDVGVGSESGDRIAVTRGLRSGELVVIEGGTALQDGMKVRTR